MRKYWDQYYIYIVLFTAFCAYWLVLARYAQKEALQTSASSGAPLSALIEGAASSTLNSQKSERDLDLRARIDFNREEAPDLTDSPEKPSVGRLPKTGLIQEQTNENVLRDIQEATGRPRRTLNPDEQVSLAVSKMAWLKEYDANYRAAYIATFLRNARAAGMNVELNKDLVVVGISPTWDKRPIRIPQSEGSFHDDAHEKISLILAESMFLAPHLPPLCLISN